MAIVRLSRPRSILSGASGGTGPLVRLFMNHDALWFQMFGNVINVSNGASDHTMMDGQLSAVIEFMNLIANIRCFAKLIMNVGAVMVSRNERRQRFSASRFDEAKFVGTDSSQWKC